MEGRFLQNDISDRFFLSFKVTQLKVKKCFKNLKTFPCLTHSPTSHSVYTHSVFRHTIKSNIVRKMKHGTCFSSSSFSSPLLPEFILLSFTSFMILPRHNNTHTHMLSSSSLLVVFVHYIFVHTRVSRVERKTACCCCFKGGWMYIHTNFYHFVVHPPEMNLFSLSYIPDCCEEDNKSL